MAHRHFGRGVGLLAAFAALSCGPALAGDWMVYTAADRSYSVSLPTAPELDPESGGRSISSSPSAHESYIVVYTPINRSAEGISDKLFAAALQSFTDNHATIVILNAHPVLGHPGEDVQLRSKEGYLVWERLIAVNDRVYQLMHISDGDGEKPIRFWNSFVLQPQ